MERRLGPRRSRRRARRSVALPAPFEIPREIYDGWREKGGYRRRAGLERQIRGVRENAPGACTRVPPPRAGELPANWDARCLEPVEQIIAKTNPSPLARLRRTRSKASRRSCPNWSGLGRPDRLQPHAGGPAPSPSGGGGWQTTIYYGVREFGMSAVMNAWRCTAESFLTAAPFLTFSDYSRTRCAWRADEDSLDLRLYPRLDRSGEDAPHTSPSSTPRRCA